MSFQLLCPECHAELEVSGLSGENSCPVCSSEIDLESVGNAQCPVCGTPFSDGDVILICSHCKTPHHKECWEDNHGCSTYGCESTQHQETHQDGTSSDMVACPACGTMHASTDLVCFSCGKVFSDAEPVSNQFSGMFSSFASGPRKAFQMGHMSCKRIWPVFRQDLNGIKEDVVSCIQLFWDAYRKYAQFRGKSGRSELISFVVIEMLIFIVVSEPAISFLFFLVSVIPTLALCVRRLHDVGMPFWMIFVPVLCPLLLIAPSLPEPGE